MVKMAGFVRTQFSNGIRNLYHCARSKHHKSLMPEVFLHPLSAGGICYCFLHIHLGPTADVVTCGRGRFKSRS